jgi:hypothetical protein
MQDTDIQDAYLGFEHKGKTYPGVKSLILDLKWALLNGAWNISRTNYENGGLVNIKS